MFQVNAASILQFLLTIASLAAFISIAFNILQYLLNRRYRRQKEKYRRLQENIQKEEEMRRYLTNKVYEPLMDGLTALIREIDYDQVSFKIWEYGRTGLIGTLLEIDDPQLFQELDGFYIERVCRFNNEIAIYNMKKQLQGEAAEKANIKKTVENLEFLRGSIIDWGGDLLAQLQNKIRI